MKWPALPERWFSALGEVAVTYMRAKKAKKRNLCGQFDWCAREITVRPDMAPEAEWFTLWHEATHVALMDAGVHGNVLTKEQEESVCDAMGAYMAGMMRSGLLKIAPNWKESAK